MNRIVLIAFAVLLSFTALFGYLSYSFHSDKAIVVGELRVAQESLKTAQKAYETKDMSCKINDTSVVEVEKEKKELQTKVETLSEQIASLKSKKLLTKPIATSKDEVKSYLTGDEMLSEELVVLLHNSYCTVEPSSSECLKSNSP